MDNNYNNYNNYYNNGGKKPQGDNTAKIILGVIAGMALIIIILLAVLIFSRGYSKEKDNIQTNNVNTGESVVVGEESETAGIVTEESRVEESVEVESEIEEPKVEETKLEETATEESVVEEVELVMSDELFDFTFELDGVVYQLPCSYQKFVDNGWTISSTGCSSETLIWGNDNVGYQMSKNGQTIDLYSYNFSGNAKKLGDCKVGGVACDSHYKTSLEMAKGIEVGATPEEIIETFGEPTESNIGASYITYRYLKDNSNYNRVRFYYDTTSAYWTVEMINFVATDDDKTENNTERPAYLDEYQAPTELGTDIFASIVGIDGDVYQLPLPMSCFLDNGWEITQKPGSVVSGGKEYSIRLEKDGKKLYASVINGAEYQTTVENCVVYKLSVDEYAGAALILPEEDAQITLGMTKAALEEILPEDFDYYEGTYSYNYNYSEYRDRDFSIYIAVSVETGLVNNIAVSCLTWSY